MKMSIAIPTWECYGRGGEFLDDLLRTIEIQTFKDFEVCISDHSKDDNVLNVVKQFENKFKIVYFRNENNRGNGPVNTNKSIDMCSGDIIKVMFQDDFFYDDESLQKIHTSLSNSDNMWLVNGCNHTNNDGHSFYNEMYPRWNDDIINGVNTISSPSVLSIKKGVFNKVKFDTDLTMMMDCEFYYHVKKSFGDPIYYDDILVTNRVHSEQISQLHYGDKTHHEKMNKEVSYCIQKHK